MIRYGEVSIPELFQKISESGAYISFTVGDKIFSVKRTSQRYRLFKKNGLKCVVCKKVANKAYLESNVDGERPHVNFYLSRPGMKDLLFTKDHILPKAKGGKDTMSNYQTMCQVCNSKKGSTC